MYVESCPKAIFDQIPVYARNRQISIYITKQGYRYTSTMIRCSSTTDKKGRLKGELNASKKSCDFIYSPTSSANWEMNVNVDAFFLLSLSFEIWISIYRNEQPFNFSINVLCTNRYAWINPTSHQSFSQSMCGTNTSIL